MTKKIIIAIDGPAASGKSTTAKKIAEALGYTYIDTGAMYRAITLKLLLQDAYEKAVHNETYLRDFLNNTEVLLDRGKTFLDGNDVSSEIRENAVSTHVSKVSSLKPVRDKMSTYQRKMGEKRGVVMDGRDIGTVIFPDAELKIYMIASPHERAKRRFEELKLKSKTGFISLSLEELEKEIRERDFEDMNREISPLQKPHDAIELDTSFLSIDEQVSTILALANRVLSSSH
ncbi:MAG: (d)CMP kinase [Chloroherpetonaceae bacterium]|nr:(d)CMP kinase [Chloroherpetonaceae bacterium]